MPATAATPVTQRAIERFPSADVLVDYMADFAKPQERDGHISYNTDVRHCAWPIVSSLRARNVNVLISRGSSAR